MATNLNLTAIRNKKYPGFSQSGFSINEYLSEKFENAPTLTRRQMLKITSIAAAAGASKFISTKNPPILGTYEMVESRGRIAFKINGQEKWVIDVKKFGGSPSLKVNKLNNFTIIKLINAFYPGTYIPADFIAKLKQNTIASEMRIKFAFAELAGKVHFEKWLAGLEAIQLKAKLSHFVKLNKRSELLLAGYAKAEYAPDWTLNLHGKKIANIFGMQSDNIFSDKVIISTLKHDDVSLMKRPAAKRTLFTLFRGQHDWSSIIRNIQWDNEELISVENSFDIIKIEASQSQKGQYKRALIAESIGDEARLHFKPKGNLLGEEGKPFTLPLKQVKYAATFNSTEKEHEVLIADFIDEPFWLHANNTSLHIGKSSDAQLFEIEWKNSAIKNLICSPALLKAETNFGNNLITNTTIAENAKLQLVLNNGNSNKTSRLLANSRMVVWRVFPPSELNVLRPEDMLILTFKFNNLRFSYEDGNTYLVRYNERTPAYLTVEFQPQSIAEEAFFKSSGSTPDAEALAGMSEGERTRLELDTGTQSLSNPPVQKRLSGKSRLVFNVSELEKISYSLLPSGDIPGLLDWQSFELKVNPRALKNGPKTTSVKVISQPDESDTAIEVPWHLILSPNESGGWAHKLESVQHNGVYELWHTRFAVKKNDGRIDEQDDTNRTVRAIWATGFPPNWTFDLDGHRLGPYPAPDPNHNEPFNNIDPFRMSLDEQDRYEIVRLSSDYNISSYPPLPINVQLLMLTALGGWLKSKGAWDPPSGQPLEIEAWDHIATMGRDHYAKVVYKGYLFPFGHRASLIKVTEREFEDTESSSSDGGYKIAYMRQRMYIIVRQPEIVYSPNLDNDPYKDFPFKKISITSLVTPDLDQPNASQIGALGQRAFWPKVNEQDFLFTVVAEDKKGIINTSQIAQFSKSGNNITATIQGQCFYKVGDPVTILGATSAGNNGEFVITAINSNLLGFTYVNAGGISETGNSATKARVANDGERCEFTIPLIFISKTAEEDFREQIKNAYNAIVLVDAKRTRPMNGQTIAFAKCKKDGDTSLETASISFEADLRTGTLGTQANELIPRFKPVLNKAGVKHPVIARMTQIGGTNEVMEVAYHNTFKNQGFNVNNPGRLFLNVTGTGQVNFRPDRSGGAVTPNFNMQAISRSLGPVPQNFDDFLQGIPDINFSNFAESFFEAAKFLGGLFLGDIIDFPDLSDLSSISSLFSTDQSIRDLLPNVEQAFSAFSANDIKVIQEGLIRRESFYNIIGDLPADVRSELGDITEDATNQLFESITALGQFPIFRAAADIINNPQILDLILSGDLEYLLPNLLKILEKLDLYFINRIVTDASSFNLTNFKARVNAFRLELEAELNNALAEQLFGAVQAIRTSSMSSLATVISHVPSLNFIRQYLSIDDMSEIRTLEQLENFLNEHSLTLPADLSQVQLLNAINSIESQIINLISSINSSSFSDVLKKLLKKLPLNFLDISIGLPSLDQLNTALVDIVIGQVYEVINSIKGTLPFYAAKEIIGKISSFTNTDFITVLSTEVSNIIGNNFSFEHVLSIKQEGISRLNDLIEDSTLIPSLNESQRIQLQNAKNQIFAAIDSLGQIASIISFIRNIFNGVEVEVFNHSWNPEIKSDRLGIFEPLPSGTVHKISINMMIRAGLSLTANPSASYEINGHIGRFNINLLTGDFQFITVEFNKFDFRVTGTLDDLDVNLDPDVAGIQLFGPLSFVNRLKDYLFGSNQDAGSSGLIRNINMEGAEVGFMLAIPNVAIGVFSMQNISLSGSVYIPFGVVEGNASGVTVRFSFCTQQDPFILTVGPFGGGGFFKVGLTIDGLEQVEMSLQFGACIALDIGVASGSVSIMGGIYFGLMPANQLQLPSGTSLPAGMNPNEPAVLLTGFVAINGEMEFLGLISVSVRFYLALTYIRVGEKAIVAGEATIEVEIDLWLFSMTVRATTRREFAGSDPDFEMLMSRDNWNEYCSAFASIAA